MRTIILLLLTMFLHHDSVIPAQQPLKVCLISGSNEYRSQESLSSFKNYLEERTSARCTLIQARGEKNKFGEFDDMPGLEALDSCDVALVFTRRLTISGKQLEQVKAYCERGKPIVAVRTASHGFQNWLEFDKLVLGGNYQGHFGGGTTIKATIQPEAKDHPILDGVGAIHSKASLYKTEPLAPDAQLLMMGSTPENSQPLAWARPHKAARVFYTSLGTRADFENDTFRRLLANALFWTAGRQPTWKDLPSPPARVKPR